MATECVMPSKWNRHASMLVISNLDWFELQGLFSERADRDVQKSTKPVKHIIVHWRKNSKTEYNSSLPFWQSKNFWNTLLEDTSNTNQNWTVKFTIRNKKKCKIYRRQVPSRTAQQNNLSLLMSGANMFFSQQKTKKHHPTLHGVLQHIVRTSETYRYPAFLQTYLTFKGPFNSI